jgi:hypothetical protein
MIEAVIVAAISVLIFGALLFSFKYSLGLVAVSRAKLSAMSLANDRLEYFRSLPYNNVGTILGIPAGTIPQNSTTTLNDIPFREKVLVEYVDDDADGLGASDSNGIPADYKRVKLTYTWEINGETYSIFSVSDIVSRSVETTAGGGTVRINVIDANSALLPGASVRLFNNTTSPNIDVTRVTDATGAALFSGAPAASEYQVEVTATISGQQYSTDQTYPATVANPIPLVAPFSVLESDVSTLTFQVDDLSDLTILAKSAITESSFQEMFVDLLAVASSSRVVASGELALSDTLGVHETNGFAYLGPITPVPLQAWQTVRVVASAPADTAYRVQFFTSAVPGSFTLVPDSDLPGNAAGFSTTPIDISSLDTGVYPTLYVGIVLETTDTSKTPEIEEVTVFYRESETVLATPFSIHGNKIIGSDASAQPIYKYDTSLNTDGSGAHTITDLEFDTYIVGVSGYDIASACPAHPFAHIAGEDGELELVLVANAADTLRVSVVDTLGHVVPGATVRVSRAGYDVSIMTDGCGQAFFTGGVAAESDYSVEVAATGYTTYTASSFTISGDTTTAVTLTE